MTITIGKRARSTTTGLVIHLALWGVLGLPRPAGAANPGAAPERGALAVATRIVSGGLRIAALNLRPRGVAPELATALTEFLVVELEKFEQVFVLSEVDMQAQLTDLANRQFLNLDECGAETCFAELTRQLDSDFLLYGTVAKVGHFTSISLALIDRDRSNVVARVNQTLSGDRERLVAGMQAAAFNLISAARGDLSGRAISVGTVEDLRVAQTPKQLDGYFTAGTSLFIDLDGAGMLNAPAFSTRLGVDYNLLDWLLIGVNGGLDTVASETVSNSFIGDVASGQASHNKLVGRLTLRTISGLARVTIRRPFGLILPYGYLGAGVCFHDLNLGDEHNEPVNPEDTLPVDIRNRRKDTSGWAPAAEIGAGVELLFTQKWGLIFSVSMFKSFHQLELKTEIDGFAELSEQTRDFQTIQSVLVQAGLVLQL